MTPKRRKKKKNTCHIVLLGRHDDFTGFAIELTLRDLKKQLEGQGILGFRLTNNYWVGINTIKTAHYSGEELD